MEILQAKDPTLEKMRRIANGTEESRQGIRYEKRDGLLYRVSETKEDKREQLVLPTACRSEVSKLAHYTNGRTLETEENN